MTPRVSSSPPIFRVQALDKRYGDKVVLAGIDLDIDRGECFVVLGRSGSGKSVFLRQLNGLEKPSAGRIFFDGTEITGLSERQLFDIRRRIAMLFQSGALFDSLTVLENVAFPLREHTDLTDEQIADAVRDRLSLVGLKDIENKMPADLSGGMKKRVALARSLALDPEVVLFDEPTTGLDPVTAASIGDLIRSTHGHTGCTVVVVTHDLALARRVGDRVGYLHDGRFRFTGTWTEASESDDPVLADFLAGRRAEAAVA